MRGYANAPDFMKWQLDLLPNGEAAQAIFLAFGEEAGQFTYSLDTTGLPAGEHTLRLRVVRGGQQLRRVSVEVHDQVVRGRR